LAPPLLFAELRSALHLSQSPLLRVQAAMLFTMSSSLLSLKWEDGVEEYFASWMLKALPTLRQDLVRVFSPKGEAGAVPLPQDNEWDDCFEEDAFFSLKMRAPLLHPAFAPIHFACQYHANSLIAVSKGVNSTSYLREHCWARLAYLKEYSPNLPSLKPLCLEGAAFWDHSYSSLTLKSALAWATKLEPMVRASSGVPRVLWEGDDPRWGLVHEQEELLRHLHSRSNFNAALFAEVAEKVSDLLGLADLTCSDHPLQQGELARLQGVSP
jgi:hypothetical protein